MNSMTNEIRGVKNGVILRRGTETPHTITIYRDNGPEGWIIKTPICLDCGWAMKEAVSCVNGRDFYRWWCPSEECKARHAAAFAVLHGKARAADIDTRPEKILPVHGIPALYHHARLDLFDGDMRIMRAARAWVESPSDLFIYGTPGAGKTWLSCALLVELIRAGGHTVFFSPVKEYLFLLRATFDRDDDGDRARELDIINRFGSYDFLCLDDAGAGSASDFTADRILTLLDRRQGAKRITIVTSNLDIAGIGERLDVRIGSRLSAGKVWEVTGPDRRARR